MFILENVSCLVLHYKIYTCLSTYATWYTQECQFINLNPVDQIEKESYSQNVSCADIPKHKKVSHTTVSHLFILDFTICSHICRKQLVG